MNRKDEIHKLAMEMADRLPPVHTEAELRELTEELRKFTIERALNAELEYHLETEESANSRNGYSSKTIRTEDGNIELITPRDRNSTFEPALIKKGQRRFTSMDDKIRALYARGMTTRDIVNAFQEMYNALGVNLEGRKELRGIWISEHEGSKFWLSILTEVQTRGVKDIFIACVDGLSGFPEAVNTVYPSAKVQLCIVHMIRSSLKYVSYKDYKRVTADLKRIYTYSITVPAGSFKQCNISGV